MPGRDACDTDVSFAYHVGRRNPLSRLLNSHHPLNTDASSTPPYLSRHRICVGNSAPDPRTLCPLPPHTVARHAKDTLTTIPVFEPHLKKFHVAFETKKQERPLSIPLTHRHNARKRPWLPMSHLRTAT